MRSGLDNHQTVQVHAMIMAFKNCRHKLHVDETTGIFMIIYICHKSVQYGWPKYS